MDSLHTQKRRYILFPPTGDDQTGEQWRRMYRDMDQVELLQEMEEKFARGEALCPICQAPLKRRSMLILYDLGELDTAEFYCPAEGCDYFVLPIPKSYYMGRLIEAKEPGKP